MIKRLISCRAQPCAKPDRVAVTAYFGGNDIALLPGESRRVDEFFWVTRRAARGRRFGLAHGVWLFVLLCNMPSVGRARASLAMLATGTKTRFQL
jgi:hypothetical protein